MRPYWDQYFLAIARVVATRATCKRLQVGAVITTESHHILSTGYNGAPRGLDHCVDVGCQMRDGHCVRCIHAEVNALLHAARQGVSLQSSRMYITVSPCQYCLMCAIQAGVHTITYARTYGSTQYASVLAKQSGIILRAVEVEHVRGV